MRRPVVLILIKGLGVGGAEKLLSEGSRFWDHDRFDYRVAYLLPWKDQLVPALVENGIAVTCLSRGRPGPSAALALRRLVRDTGAEIVHAHLPMMGVLARLVAGVPVVYTEHNVVESYQPAIRTMNRLTYRRDATVIAVSEAVARSVSRYHTRRVVTIENGVHCSVTGDDAAAAREELGLNGSDRLVVHVGNIRPWKGHENLIRTAGLLRGRAARLAIVSIGGEKHDGDLERVRAIARDAGVSDTIRFLGRREDALRFLAAADVAVNPSDFEGGPVAVLEAMALGRPVVATAVGGVPLMIRDGETGLLVPPGDPAALADGIVRILHDREEAQRLGKAARGEVEQRFGLEQMVRAVEHEYDLVLGRAPTRGRREKTSLPAEGRG